MAKKKRAKAQPPSAAEHIRGVETFDTNEAVILIAGDVEQVAKAFAKQKKAKVWPEMLGKRVTITDPCYLVLRMAGHPWTLITSCITSKKSLVSVDEAKTLSKTLKVRAIYFANSDTASYTEYQLFDAGKRLERFRCYEGIEFASDVRKVDPPEDGPGIYDFVNRFMREQDAFVPACSIHLNAGWMTVGQKVEVGPQEELFAAAFERIDFVAA